MLITWMLNLALVLDVLATPARVREGAVGCPTIGPGALRLGDWKPDSEAVAGAQTLLAQWPVDFITFDSSQMALADTIASALKNHLGENTDRVLLHVMLVSGGARDSRPQLAWAAAHFYIRLGLPRAGIEGVLATPNADPKVRAAVFELVSATPEESHDVGLARRWMVCDLARRMLTRSGLQRGERELFGRAVTILQGQARRGNTQAAELLEETSIRASRNRL